MKFVIHNTADYADVEKFIHVVIIPTLYRLVVENFDKRVLELYSKEFREQVQWMLFHKDYIVCRKSPHNMYTIMIDENKIVGGSSAKLCDICALINYGSFDYPATHIFTQVFNFVHAHFWKMYKLYMRGGRYY